MTINNKKRFYSTKEISEYLGISQAKLERDRCLFGNNPMYLPFIKINGAVRYPIDKVEKWLEERSGGGM